MTATVGLDNLQSINKSSVGTLYQPIIILFFNSNRDAVSNDNRIVINMNSEINLDQIIGLQSSLIVRQRREVTTDLINVDTNWETYTFLNLFVSVKFG
jgi:hypothetical protein